MKRSSGILLSISSLPSSYGIGCFDKAAYDFVDFLSQSGQTYWQILPLGPTGYGDSPYQSFSTFAGNPYFISLDYLISMGLLTKEECEKADLYEKDDSVSYQKQYKNRIPLLRKAFERFKPNDDYHAFCKSTAWLCDYALFMALKDHFGGKSWIDWDNDIKKREQGAVDEYTKKLKTDVEFHKFLQFCFYTQWRELKKYANKKGVFIIGDVPIYVALDSADVWEHPELFQLDENGNPISVAGCPPDSFSPEGQLWGNPLYNWEMHKKTDFKWWTERISHAFSLFDVVRLDHFRGFAEYYSIPSSSQNATDGKWEKGPDIELFKALEKHLGKREFIAEDLGFVTDSVKMLLWGSGFAGMKVLQFAFDDRDENNHNDYLPHNYSENCVAYTGTHDNQTLFSWFDTISNAEREAAIDYLDAIKIESGGLCKRFASAIMQSRARLCIIPMQDWLGLDDKARMNTPSLFGGNWQWRMKKDALTPELSREILTLTKKYGR